MRKILLLLLFICILVCGCGKNETTDEQKTNDTTTIPEKEPTKTEKVQETNTEKIACAVCGEITDCMSYTKKIWNNELGDYLKKAFYLCSDCYLDVVKNETDCINYECIIEDTQLALAFKENYKIISQLEGEGYIKLTPSGFTFDNIEQGIIDQLYVIDPSFDTIKTQKEYSIKVVYGKYPSVIKDIEPVNILDLVSQ